MRYIMRDSLICRSPPLFLYCVKSQLQDATNQARNSSRHQIKNYGVGLLAVSVEKQTSQERKDNPSQITLHTSLIDELWVQIAIADNGFGIPQEIQKYIFDPFFTTKPVGKGTGMGMSISYQIVTEKHGGKLECFSSFGKGTEFVIKIPLQQILSRTK